MSKSYEFQAKNVEQALSQASDALNIPVEKIKHEVVAYGSSGIFGLVGVKKAKIKVFIDEERKKKAQRPRSEQKRTQALETIEPASGRQPTDIPSTDAPDVDEELISFGTKALEQIVGGITAEATVQFEKRGDRLCYAVTGGDSGVLIGKRGQTLEATQYLLEKMINKRSAHRVRVIVDVEGYLEKRKSNLKQMASRMAEKAKKIQKPVTIGQMNAHDRRIVHIHLKDESGVRTQSIGNGYYRKLMIFPKKQTDARRKGRDSKT